MSEKLSVVIITRNQEWNINRILKSVIKQIPNTKEIVLVDSASTDRTIEFASNYPIKIIRLNPDQRLTAAAGRYVGYVNTSGEYLLFLDGDVELLEKWHQFAFEIIRDPQIGAVGGKYINVPKSGSTNLDIKRTEPPIKREVFHPGGAAVIYRRTVLDETGSFTPYIYSDEEPALAVRIRNCGYRVVRLDYPSCLHYTDPPAEITTLFARRSRNLWVGHGQNIRYFMGTDMLSEYLKERGHGILPALYLLLLIITIFLTIFTGNLLWLALSVLILFVVFVALSIYRRSPRSALYTVVQRFIILEGTIRGMLDKPIKPEDYNLEYEIIQQ